MSEAASRAELVEALRSLEPWSTAGAMSRAAWARYIQVARLVQQSPPATVKEALEDFCRSPGERDGGHLPESKAFLLMRVIFCLPERLYVGEDAGVCGGWMGDSGPICNGYASLSWPVSWATGSPVLVADYWGYDGGPYPADKEYAYWLSQYPFRDLTCALGPDSEDTE